MRSATPTPSRASAPPPDFAEVRARYRELLGGVPETVERRLQLAALAGRADAVDAVERLRTVLIHENPLDRKTQQLVHLAMLIGAGETGPAALHARGARRAGATARELFGVCETAAVVAGMPGLSRAVDAVYAALANECDVGADGRCDARPRCGLATPSEPGA